METTRKSVYPLHKFDIDENVNSEDSIMDAEKVLEVDSRLKAHFFDHPLPVRNNSKSGFKQLSKLNELQRCTMPIRADFYHINESKISALKWLGIYPDTDTQVIKKLNAICNKLGIKTE